MTKIKLFPKIFMLTTALFLAVSIIIHTCIFFLIPQIYRNQKESDTSKKITELTGKIDGKNLKEILKRAKEYSESKNVNVNIISGKKEYFFQQFKTVNMQPSAEITGDLTIIIDDKYVDMNSIILKVRKVKDSRGGVITVQLMTDVRPIAEARAATLKTLPYSIAVSLICALLFSYFYSRFTTKPIKNMVKVTGSMKKLDKNAHYNIMGDDEINVLGSHINELYSDLWNTIDSLEKENIRISGMEKERLTFMRAASHELKTPLTSLRVMLENMMLNIGEYKDHTKYLNESIATVDKMYEMIRNIMVSHDEIKGGAYNEESEVRLDGILENVFDEYRIFAEAKGVKVAVNTEPVTVFNNASLVEKVLSNIISNAIHYTEKNKNVEITLTQNYLSVKNQCVPIDEDKLEKIFEPLYRIDESRNSEMGGSGMGLYIVKMLLESKGINYSFLPYEEGMDFKIEIHGYKKA